MTDLMNVEQVYDEELDAPVWKVTSNKTKSTLTVYKANNGFALFEIKADKGLLSPRLSGSYTTPEKALKAIEHYLRVVRESTTVRRDANTKAREEQKKKLQDASTA